MCNVMIVVEMLRGSLEDGHALHYRGAARSIIPCVQELQRSETENASYVLYPS